MINQQLIDYIKQQLGQGISQETIISELLNSGWQQSDMDEVFRMVNQTVNMNSQNNQTSIKQVNKKRGMRPWLINLIVLIGVFVLMILLPEESASSVGVLIVIASSIWAARDASQLQINKYASKFLSVGNTPNAVAVSIFLIWPLAFPMYISYRQKIIDGKIPLK